MHERRVINDRNLQKVYNGFIDQNPKPFSSPFSREVEKAYEYGLHHGETPDIHRLFKGDTAHERGAIAAAYRAGTDLLSGLAKRGDTYLFDAWIKGDKQIMLPDFLFAKHTAKRLGKHWNDDVFAFRYRGQVFYEWGAVAGHAFPTDAIGITPLSMRFELPNWVQARNGLRFVADYDKASYPTRRNRFNELMQTVARGSVPDKALPRMIFNKHGELGLLRYYFRNRWSAAVQTPNMQLAQGVSHMRVKSITSEYLLCSMDDAIMHRMQGVNCIIYDLNTPLEGIDV